MIDTLEQLAAPKAPEAGLRVTCLQDHLHRAMGIVTRATGNRHTMPILGYVLATTDGERVRLTATNLDLSVTTWVPGRVRSEGVACLPASLLRETIAALPSGRDVSLDVAGTAVRVECERVGANLKGADPGEFPPVALLDEAPLVRLPAAEFRRAIEQVAFAAAKDDARPVLSGVHLRLGAGGLRLAGADGFRLSILHHVLPDTSTVTGEADVIVPARTVLEVARLLEGYDATVEIGVAPNRTQVGFRVRSPGGEALVTGRLLEGVFPDVERIVPQNATTAVTVGREALAQAIKVASIFARDSAHNVGLEVTLGQDDSGELTVKASSADTGDNVTRVPCRAVGEGCAVHFSTEFLSDWLGSVKTPQVVLELSGPTSPGLFRGLGAPGVSHVIMPMHARQ